MRKAFLSNIFLLLGLNILVKPLYIFGIDVQVQNIVGPENYGVYFALFNFCYLFQIVLDPGIQNMNTQSVAQDNVLFKTRFPQILFIKTVLAILFSVFILGVAFILDYPQEFYKTILLIILFQIIISLLLFVRGNISALGYYRYDSLLSALDKILLVLGLGYVIWFSPFSDQITIQWFVIAQIISVSITLIIALAVLFPRYRSLKFNFDFSALFQLLKKALPFGLVFLLMTLYTRMDGVMLERMLDDNGYEAGIYAAAYKLYDASNMMGFLFATLLLPMFSKILGSTNRIQLLSEQALKIMLPASMVIVIGLCFYAEDCMRFLFDDGNAYYAQVLQVLMLSFFCVSLSYIYGTLVTATGQLKQMNILFVFGIILNWGLNFSIIPEHKAVGAAYATLATQFLVVLGQIYLAFKLSNLKINYVLLLKACFAVAISISIFFLIDSLLKLHWMQKIIISSIFSLIISFLVGLLRLDFAKDSIENI